jgi:hypothetical protein
MNPLPRLLHTCPLLRLSILEGSINAHLVADLYLPLLGYVTAGVIVQLGNTNPKLMPSTAEQACQALPFLVQGHECSTS